MKNNNKSCPYKKLPVFYNSCLKTFGSHLVLFSGKHVQVAALLTCVLEVFNPNLSWDSVYPGQGVCGFPQFPLTCRDTTSV